MSMKLESFKKASNRVDYGRLEEGTYPARGVMVVYLGRHQATDWKTGEVKHYDDGNPVIQPRAFLTWEFPTETIEIDGEEKPRWYSKEYTVSAHEKAIMPQVLAAVGAGDDMAKFVDKPCLVTIGSTNTNKPKVTGVTKLPKGMDVGPLMNEPKVFDPFDPDMEVWESLPNFIQSKIREAEDFDEMKLSKLLAVKTTNDSEEYDDEELPF